MQKKIYSTSAKTTFFSVRDLYEKIKKKESLNLNLTPSHHMTCFIFKPSQRIRRELKRTRKVKKQKNRGGRFPALEIFLVDFVNRCQGYLSEYRFGLSWGVVKTQAFIFAEQLSEGGIMRNEEYVFQSGIYTKDTKDKVF